VFYLLKSQASHAERCYGYHQLGGFTKMKSMKKLIAVICVVLLLSTPFIAFSDEQPQGSTVIEKSDPSTDTQQGTVPDTQVTPQVPEPEAEQPAASPGK
jgi:hypothetical protein